MTESAESRRELFSATWMTLPALLQMFFIVALDGQDVDNTRLHLVSSGLGIDLLLFDGAGRIQRVDGGKPTELRMDALEGHHYRSGGSTTFQMLGITRAELGIVSMGRDENARGGVLFDRADASEVVDAYLSWWRQRMCVGALFGSTIVRIQSAIEQHDLPVDVVMHALNDLPSELGMNWVGASSPEAQRMRASLAEVQEIAEDYAVNSVRIRVHDEYLNQQVSHNEDVSVWFEAGMEEAIAEELRRGKSRAVVVLLQISISCSG